MNTKIAYNKQGEIMSVTMPDAENSKNLAVDPQEGGFVLEVDPSTIAHKSAGHTDEEIMLAIVNEYRVDHAKKQLVRKGGN